MAINMNNIQETIYFLSGLVVCIRHLSLQRGLVAAGVWLRKGQSETGCSFKPRHLLVGTVEQVCATSPHTVLSPAGSGVNLLLITPEKAIKLVGNDFFRHILSTDK